MSVIIYMPPTPDTYTHIHTRARARNEGQLYYLDQGNPPI